MNIQRIKTNALKYLGYNNQSPDMNTQQVLDECIDEILSIAHPVFMHQEYVLEKNPLKLKESNIDLNYGDLNDLLKNCEKCIVIACSLGIDVDKRIKYLSFSNMSKMVIFDAVASSYIEIVCDEYENKLNLGKRTFRFCPGYGNVPIALNRDLARILNCEKHIGLHVSTHDLLNPMKSMIGLIGIGDDCEQKTCLHCFHIKDCEYRKRGCTCY